MDGAADLLLDSTGMVSEYEPHPIGMLRTWQSDANRLMFCTSQSDGGDEQANSKAFD